jgi:hypothetical protein
MFLNTYHHAWGVDPLASLPVKRWRVYRDMARLPSEIQTVTMPATFVTTGDRDLAMMIHDYQNRLLNLQLRSELLSRTTKTSVVKPPDSLPDQAASASERLQAIYSNLGWWADFYTEAMGSSLESKAAGV